MPPEISRFPFGTKVIKILDLSPYLPPTRPFTVSSTLSYSPKPVLPISKASLSYSPKPVLHQPRHQTEFTPLVHQSPCTFYPHLTLSYNNTHQSSSSLPTITKFAFPTGPSALLSFLFPKTSPSPTTPPARIRSSRSSISLHVLSSSHPALQQHSSVHSSLPIYNYQVRFPDRSLRIVILPIPQNQSFTNHATRQNPLLSFINLLARLSSSHPVLRQHSSVQFITSYNYQVRFPDSSLRIVILQTRNSKLATHGIAGNCTEFEAVSTYVTLK